MLTAIIAGILTFILTLVGIPAFIRFYHKAHISGQQMHEDVKQHQAKAGTPTMGGTVFLVASVLASFVTALFSQQLSNGLIMILFILVLYGIVGFLDDFLKVFRKINEGLNPKQKLALQLVGGVVFYFFYNLIIFFSCKYFRYNNTICIFLNNRSIFSNFFHFFWYIYI